jgi:hypothetical protein
MEVCLRKEFKKGVKIELNWIKCEGNEWCDLLLVNLDHPHFNNLEGVYIIWHGGSNPTTLRVGQGVIRDRLSAHRNEDEILDYREHRLYVTWAKVSTSQRDGVEKYLAEKLNPKIGAHFPDATPIPVNLPE